ncbi:MAG: hypothetical protein AB1540_11780 [Bdellovibrionota bacterium]
MKQLKLLKNQKSAYGGELMKTRKGRKGSRPLATRESMHLVLRSSKATEEWSFTRPKHAAKIKQLTSKFAAKYGVKVYSVANVGNHLHFHLKLGNRFTYRPFIRALTSAIAMAVTGTSRWTRPVKAARAVAVAKGTSMTKAQPQATAAVAGAASNSRRATATDSTAQASPQKQKLRFWDYRPYTRIVQSFQALLNLKDYIRINTLEGYGYKRDQARFILAWNRAAKGFG